MQDGHVLAVIVPGAFGTQGKHDGPITRCDALSARDLSDEVTPDKWGSRMRQANIRRSLGSLVQPGTTWTKQAEQLSKTLVGDSAWPGELVKEASLKRGA